MILYEQGKAYWVIAARYHAHRNNPAMAPVAVRDMQRLQQSTTCQAVLRRINSFIAKHRPKPPGNMPDGDGPRYA